MNNTQNIFDRVLESGKTARRRIEEINKKLEGDIEAAKDDLKAGMIGENGYKKLVGELRADAEERIKSATSEINSIVTEYNETVRLWGEMSGDKLTSDAELLMSGIKLSAEEVQKLADKYQYNPVMSRLVKQYWEVRGNEINRHNQKMRETVLNYPWESDTVNFNHQTADSRIDKFEKFAENVKHIAETGFFMKEYADADDYMNAIARRTLPEIQPLDSDEVYDYDRYAAVVKEDKSGSYTLI